MGLRERRERCGLTLLQLEALTGIAFTRLSTLECNASEARNMYLGTARRIADALHCNVLDLYPDEDAWRGGVSAGVEDSSGTAFDAADAVSLDGYSPA